MFYFQIWISSITLLILNTIAFVSKWISIEPVEGEEFCFVTWDNEIDVPDATTVEGAILTGRIPARFYLHPPLKRIALYGQ